MDLNIKEKRDDLQALISDKYAHLKDALAKAPKAVRENPWLVGGVALSLLTAGALFYLYAKSRS
jgi:ElaB/YqjD/DUF883 family membrane-anchored ribosome-binding protein